MRAASIKRDKATDAELKALATCIGEKEKAIRELETKATSIDAAVFDLKAVNPNAVTKVDNRTPQQIIQNIQTQGWIIADALGRLGKLFSATAK